MSISISGFLGMATRPMVPPRRQACNAKSIEGLLPAQSKQRSAPTPSVSCQMVSKTPLSIKSITWVAPNSSAFSLRAPVSRTMVLLPMARQSISIAIPTGPQPTMTVQPPGTRPACSIAWNAVETVSVSAPWSAVRFLGTLCNTSVR